MMQSPLYMVSLVSLIPVPIVLNPTTIWDNMRVKSIKTTVLRVYNRVVPITFIVVKDT